MSPPLLPFLLVVVLAPLRIAAQDIPLSPSSLFATFSISNASTSTIVSTQLATTAGPVVTVDGERSTVTTTTYPASILASYSSRGAVSSSTSSSLPSLPLSSSVPAPSTSLSTRSLPWSSTTASATSIVVPSTSSTIVQPSSPSAMSSGTLVTSPIPSTLSRTTLSAATSLSTRPTSSTSIPPSSSSPSSPTQSILTTTSLMTMTAFPSPTSSPSRISHRQRNVIIALSVVLGIVFITFLLFAAFLIRRWHRKRTAVTRTGDSKLDAEIEGWRSSKGTTDGANLTGGSSSDPNRRSSGSLQRRSGEWDDEKALQRPPTAKAPNARSGLTDSAVPGAEPFVNVKRSSSKLQKRSTSRPGSRPGSLLGHHRSLSSFSIAERAPVSSDRPLTPRDTIIESMTEKDAPPLPADAEQTIRNSLGSSKSHRVSKEHQ